MTKSDRLYGELKNRIIGCEPGSAFYSFRTIMNDYSVSQATVTAATRRLIDEGLLKPNTGKEMEITDEVLKYRQDAPPVVCLAMPHWQSDWYTSSNTTSSTWLPNSAISSKSCATTGASAPRRACRRPRSTRWCWSPIRRS